MKPRNLAFGSSQELFVLSVVALEVAKKSNEILSLTFYWQIINNKCS